MPQPNFRLTATIIWAALSAGVLMFFAVALFVRLPPNASLVPVLLPVAAGLTLATTAASWLWAVRMRPARRGDAAPPAESFAITRLIVASALCEGAALFAIVAFLVTRAPPILAPFAISFAALVAHYPGERHWGRLCGGTQTGAPGRHPMIRG